MALKKNIPNLLTLTNVACGAAAAAFAFPHKGLMPGHISLSASLILLAAVFDFLDGFAARKLNAYSEQGKVLDSLADLVSFGLAPGLLLFSLASNYLYAIPGSPTAADWGGWAWLARLSCLALPLGAAWRLSRFSADTVERPYFQGIPAPAAGMFVALLGLLFNDNSESLGFIFVIDNANLLHYSLKYPANMIVLNLTIAGLMVSKWPMLSFKLKQPTFAKYRNHFLFLGFSIVLFAALRTLATLPVGLLYLLFSFLDRKRTA